jgi:hypothetical protein
MLQLPKFRGIQKKELKRILIFYLAHLMPLQEQHVIFILEIYLLTINFQLFLLEQQMFMVQDSNYID